MFCCNRKLSLVLIWLDLISIRQSLISDVHVKLLWLLGSDGCTAIGSHLSWNTTCMYIQELLYFLRLHYIHLVSLFSLLFCSLFPSCTHISCFFPLLFTLPFLVFFFSRFFFFFFLSLLNLRFFISWLCSCVCLFSPYLLHFILFYFASC